MTTQSHLSERETLPQPNQLWKKITPPESKKQKKREIFEFRVGSFCAIKVVGGLQPTTINFTPGSAQGDQHLAEGSGRFVLKLKKDSGRKVWSIWYGHTMGFLERNIEDLQDFKYFAAMSESWMFQLPRVWGGGFIQILLENFGVLCQSSGSGMVGGSPPSIKKDRKQWEDRCWICVDFFVLKHLKQFQPT